MLAEVATADGGIVLRRPDPGSAPGCTCWSMMYIRYSGTSDHERLPRSSVRKCARLFFHAPRLPVASAQTTRALFDRRRALQLVAEAA